MAVESGIMMDPILDKKLDYCFKKEDFAVQEELTVTITLSEYRDLVSKCATREADIKKAEADKWERKAEVEKLQKELALAREMICKYQMKEEATKEGV